jgi:hypothetical protein
MATKKQIKLAGKHVRKPKREESYQQLGLFSAFSSLWQTPVR